MVCSVVRVLKLALPSKTTGGDSAIDDELSAGACPGVVFVVSKPLLSASAVDIELEEAASSSETAQREGFHVRSDTTGTFLAIQIGVLQFLPLAGVWRVRFGVFAQ